MAGSSSSVSKNQSSSSSTSQSDTQVLDYPERAFLDSIAQYAGQVGQNVYNWAQGEYAKNSSLTDANINNYLNTSSRALGQADSLQNTYKNTALPESENIIREGNNYASDARQLSDMGAAESGQMQGNEAALANHKRDLQSYGIDPSAGRYAGLDEAARVSGAAAAVGAAQQARQFDITTGQNLQQQGLNALNSTTGAFQGATTNAENTALQGFAGSENAGLADANTGVSLQGAANPFLNTASSYKPITGTKSTSDSSSQSTGDTTSSSATTDPPQASKSPTEPKQPTDKAGSDGSGSGAGTGAGGGISSGGSSGSGSSGSSGLTTDNNGDFPFDGSFDYSGNDSTPQDFTDNGGTGTADNFSLDYSGGSTYGFDGSGSMDSSGVSNDLGDFSGGGDYGAYAEGGTIDDDTGAIPEDGGAIPPSASPSGGRQVDDVHAQLPSGKQINVNAREFVIPEDVARWKGEEFFQKLIAQSRQARVTAPAKPSQGAPQRQQAHGI